MPIMEEYNDSQVTEMGYKCPGYEEMYVKDLVRQSSNPDNYGGAYLGPEDGVDPDWVKAQVDMAKAMQVTVASNGYTYIDNLAYNCYRYRDLLCTLQIPVKIICCTRIGDGMNMFMPHPTKSPRMYKQFMDEYKEVERDYRFHKYDDYSYSLQPVYDHEINVKHAHSGASQGGCLMAVVDIALKMLNALK